MTRPAVRVIGYTTFLGVPEELQGKGPAAGQDEGSDLARLIECAGRTCYDSYGKGRKSSEYHANILGSGHGSVLEHAVINFYISGISRGCSHEWVRHRVGTAVSQRSTRYVDESESDWCWHPLILSHADAITQDKLIEIEKMTKMAYEEIVAQLQSCLVKAGVNPLSARKQSRGAARGVLGNALTTSMVWSANIRALRNVIEQRASEFADAEIRLLANQIYEKSKEVCPEYFSDYLTYPALDGIGYIINTSLERRKI